MVVPVSLHSRIREEAHLMEQKVYDCLRWFVLCEG